MRKLLVATALVSALALGACATNPIGPVVIPPTGNTGIDTTISSVVAATVKACGFKPSEQTVAAIITSFIPGGGAVNAIVNMVTDAICNAVTPPRASGARRAALRPSMEVNGIPVRGQFVK